MNRRQRLTVVSGLLLLGLILMFPPWVYTIKGLHVGDAGYAPVFSPPGKKGAVVPTPDSERLLLEVLGVLVLTVAVLIMLGWTKRRTTARERSTESRSTDDGLEEGGNDDSEEDESVEDPTSEDSETMEEGFAHTADRIVIAVLAIVAIFGMAFLVIYYRV